MKVNNLETDPVLVYAHNAVDYSDDDENIQDNVHHLDIVFWEIRNTNVEQLLIDLLNVLRVDLVIVLIPVQVIVTIQID